MRPIVDVIDELRRAEARGSPSERRLASAILADPEFASRAAIGAIAARAGVSEPTVTRFSRALGAEGVRELKFRLAQALAVGGAYLGSPSPPARGVVETIADGAVAAIERVRASTDPALIEAAASRIAAARQILAFGSGGSSSIAAIELQHRLFRLGLPVAAHADGEMQRMTASVADAKTLVIAFSISGQVRPITDAVLIARRYGAATLAVTAPATPLAEAAEIAIGFAVPEDDSQLYRPSPARYALLAIVDMLALATAEAMGPPVLEGLRRIKQNLNATRTAGPGLPIGD